MVTASALSSQRGGLSAQSADAPFLGKTFRLLLLKLIPTLVFSSRYLRTYDLGRISRHGVIGPQTLLLRVYLHDCGAQKTPWWC